jgi:amidase
MAELIKKSAREIVGLLKKGEISIDDTLDTLEAHIESVDPEINALPTLCFERARAAARQGDRKDSVLSGIPVAIKDLTDVAGVRTTLGSMLYANRVPEQSDILVEQIEANGGIIYAKSNTPEFGTGGNTFNDVFGATRNPHDVSRSAGGSSGGAAAALASGTAWLAQGSDYGGSLRTPAAFCGVTSLRPSPGVFATSPGTQPFDVYSQKGPMARSVADLALFADAMAGSSSLTGLSKSHLIDEFRNAAARPVKPLKIAYSEDLGITQTSSEMAAICNAAIAKLEREQVNVEIDHPDLSMMDAAFEVPRALGYAQSYGADLASTREIMKPEVVWNVEKGLNLGADEIRQSLDAQGQIFANASRSLSCRLIPSKSATPVIPMVSSIPSIIAGWRFVAR